MRLQALRERRSLAERPQGMILDLAHCDTVARSLVASAGELAQDLPLQRCLCRHHVPADADAGVAADLEGSKRGREDFPGLREPYGRSVGRADVHGVHLRKKEVSPIVGRR